MVEWQASAFVFLCAREFRKPNTTTKADFLPLHFGEGIGYTTRVETRRLPVSSTRANHGDWAYRVSAGVLRLGIACRDDLFKQAHAFLIDVSCGVQVAIMMGATGTSPVAIRKGEIRVD